MLHSSQVDAQGEPLDFVGFGYSFTFWRERSRRRVARDGHHDAWEALKVTIASLEYGEDMLGLPALGGLFAASGTPHLIAAKNSNRRFLEALFKLGFIKKDGLTPRINWRDLNTEELGSVYEGLLEIRPSLSASGQFLLGSGAKGNDRKASGSYYTPDSLVECVGRPLPVRAETVSSIYAVAEESRIDIMVELRVPGERPFGIAVEAKIGHSPGEIGAFVDARPNRAHELNFEKGLEISAKADADFQQRLVFVEQIAGRLTLGLHDREQYNDSYNLVGDQDARMFLSLATGQLGARGRLLPLREALRARTCAGDGHRSALKKSPAPRVRTPTQKEFADHDRAMQKPGHWSKTAADWRCACCSRSKLEIMRISGRGKWTGHIHEICDYQEEMDERALAFRSAYRAERPIFGSYVKVTICQDCRLVMTDAGKLRGDGRGGENCLSPDVVRSLVGEARPNCDHDVSDQQLRQAIETSRPWSSGVNDFWTHCRHAGEASLRLSQYVDGRGMPFALARQHAITDLTQSGDLPGRNAEEVFDWLLHERERLDR